MQAGDDRKFFQSVYDHLKKQYPHCVSAYCHYDEKSRGHMHYLFVPVFHDSKKDIYKISANELVDRRALTTFHHDLSKAVEQDLGYKEQFAEYQRNNARQQGEERS